MASFSDSYSHLTLIYFGSFILFVAVALYIYEKKKRKDPESVMGSIKKEQQKEKRRLEHLKENILDEIEREKKIETEEKERLRKLGKKGTTLEKKLFHNQDSQIIELKKLISRAMHASKKKANEYYRDIYVIYYRLPDSKKKVVRKEILSLYRKMATP